MPASSTLAVAAALMAGGLVGISTAQSTYGGDVTSDDSGWYGTVTGGVANSATGYYSLAAAGYGNKASGPYSAISGGILNTATGSLSSIHAGYLNRATGSVAAVGGGFRNSATSPYSNIAGGYSNTASNFGATTSGGLHNRASGHYSNVPGGLYNTARGSYSFAAGRIARASHSYAAVLGFDSSVPECRSVGHNTVHICARGGLFLNEQECCQDLTPFEDRIDDLEEMIEDLQGTVTSHEALIERLLLLIERIEDCCPETTTAEMTTTEGTTTRDDMTTTRDPDKTTTAPCDCGDPCYDPDDPTAFLGWCNEQGTCQTAVPECECPCGEECLRYVMAADGTIVTKEGFCDLDGDCLEDLTDCDCDCDAKCFDDNGNHIGWYQANCDCLDVHPQDCPTSSTTAKMSTSTLERTTTGLIDTTTEKTTTEERKDTTEEKTTTQERTTSKMSTSTLERTTTGLIDTTTEKTTTEERKDTTEEKTTTQERKDTTEEKTTTEERKDTTEKQTTTEERKDTTTKCQCGLRCRLQQGADLSGYIGTDCECHDAPDPDCPCDCGDECFDTDMNFVGYHLDDCTCRTTYPDCDGQTFVVADVSGSKSGCEQDGLCPLTSAGMCEYAATLFEEVPDAVPNQIDNGNAVHGCSTNNAGNLRFNVATDTTTHWTGSGRVVICQKCPEV